MTLVLRATYVLHFEPRLLPKGKHSFWWNSTATHTRKDTNVCNNSTHTHKDTNVCDNSFVCRQRYGVQMWPLKVTGKDTVGISLHSWKKSSLGKVSSRLGRQFLKKRILCTHPLSVDRTMEGAACTHGSPLALPATDSSSAGAEKRQLPIRKVRIYHSAHPSGVLSGGDPYPSD